MPLLTGTRGVLLGPSLTVFGSIADYLGQLIPGRSLRIGDLEFGLHGRQMPINAVEHGVGATTNHRASPTPAVHHIVVSAAAEFARLHPDVTIDLRLNDRFVDIVAEGFDLGVRIGHLSDSSLVARKLGATEIWVVGSPNFVAQNGEPASPDDLHRFNCVRDTNFRSGNAWHFVINGAPQDVAVHGPILVNSARSGRDIALCGLALAYCPEYVVRSDVERGHLQRIMPHVPTLELPIHAIYSSSRHLPARVRAFVAFLGERLKG